ncbi:hypothetical protein TNCV_3983811 [Trichonephila clavipes]|nr:hypothetical protein TNCV_3983811 [Trichonephila clavipes]
MALDQQWNMELEPQSPYSTSSTETAPLPGKNCLFTKIGPWTQREADSLYQLAWNDFQDIQSHQVVNDFNSLHQLTWNEFQDIQSTLQQAVSDFDPLYQPHIKSRLKLPPLVLLPTRRSNQHKRKDEEDFEFPPLRKLQEKLP